MGELIFYCQHHNMVKSSLASAQVFKEHTRRGCEEHSTKRAYSAAADAVMGFQRP